MLGAKSVYPATMNDCIAGFQASATSHAGPPWIQRTQGRLPVRPCGLRNQPWMGRPSKDEYVTCSALPSGRSVKCSLRVVVFPVFRLYRERLGGLESDDQENAMKSLDLATLSEEPVKPA